MLRLCDLAMLAISVAPVAAFAPIHSAPAGGRATTDLLSAAAFAAPPLALRSPASSALSTGGVPLLGFGQLKRRNKASMGARMVAGGGALVPVAAEQVDGLPLPGIAPHSPNADTLAAWAMLRITSEIIIPGFPPPLSNANHSGSWARPAVFDVSSHLPLDHTHTQPSRARRHKSRAVTQRPHADGVSHSSHSPQVGVASHHCGCRPLCPLRGALGTISHGR